MATIREVLDGTTEATRDNPRAGQFTYTTASDLVGVTEVDVRIGDRVITVDEPQALGGTGRAPNPVEYALASLGSCQAISYRFWAEKLGVTLEGVHVTVEGDLDLRGFFGLEAGVPAGFGGVRVRVVLEGPEPDERYQQLFDAVKRHCPVLDIFERQIPVISLLEVGAGRATA